MKKLAVVFIAMMLGCPGFGQTVLTLDVRSGTDTSVSAGPGDVIPVQIFGALSGDLSDGLAHFAVNLRNVGTSAIDLAGPNFTLATPAGDMVQFDRNLGVTNPPGPVPGPTGFGGTADGANGLLQIGGGQNTLGSTGPALYPVGTVVPGVGNGATVLAEGSFTVPATGSDWVLSLDTGIANVIDVGQSGPVYRVAPAEVVIGSSLSIGFNVVCPKAGSGGMCPQCDVNESGLTEGLDIAICTSTANFGQSVATAAELCCDVNGSGIVEGLDIAICTATSCFGL